MIHLLGRFEKFVAGWVRVRFDNPAAWILEEKLPNLPNLPKYGNNYWGNEVGLARGTYAATRPAAKR
jgi:hypothetical protein